MSKTSYATLRAFLDSLGDDTVDLAKMVEYDTSLDSMNVMSTIFDLYQDQIIERRIQIKLNETELSKYMYNAKLMCSDIYGNVYMSKLILMLNSMKHEGDFDKDLIYIYNPSSTSMNDLLTMLYKYTYDFKRTVV